MEAAPHQQEPKILMPGSPQLLCSQTVGRAESLTAFLNMAGSLSKCWCSSPAPGFGSESLTQWVLRISTYEAMLRNTSLRSWEPELRLDSVPGGAAGAEAGWCAWRGIQVVLSG